MHRKQRGHIMSQNPSWYHPPQDPEERDAASYRETTQTSSVAGGTSLRWQDSMTTSANIWSPSHAARNESASPSSYGYSFGEDRSTSTLHRSGNDSFENDVVTSMANLSFHSQQSSLQAAANAPPYAASIPPSSSSLTSGSIPGLAGLSSGSMSGVDSRKRSSLATASLITGPPPGFVSPIQARRQDDTSYASSSRSGYGSSWQSNARRGGRRNRGQGRGHAADFQSTGSMGDSYSTSTSEALRALMNPVSSSSISTLEPAAPSFAPFDRPILPEQSLNLDDLLPIDDEDEDDEEDDFSYEDSAILPLSVSAVSNKDLSPKTKKREWLLRMNRRLNEIPIGELDPTTVPMSAVMNAWAKTKSAQGASMVEMWLNRAQQEYDAGNHRVQPTAKLYTMAGTFLVLWNIARVKKCYCSYDDLTLHCSRRMGQKWRRRRRGNTCRGHTSTHESTLSSGRPRQCQAHHWHFQCRH